MSCFYWRINESRACRPEEQKILTRKVCVTLKRYMLLPQKKMIFPSVFAALPLNFGLMSTETSSEKGVACSFTFFSSSFFDSILYIPSVHGHLFLILYTHRFPEGTSNKTGDVDFYWKLKTHMEAQKRPLEKENQ